PSSAGARCGSPRWVPPSRPPRCASSRARASGRVPAARTCPQGRSAAATTRPQPPPPAAEPRGSPLVPAPPVHLHSAAPASPPSLSTRPVRALLRPPEPRRLALLTRVPAALVVAAAGIRSPAPCSRPRASSAAAPRGPPSRRRPGATRPGGRPGPAPLSSPAREQPQLEEERQVRISESGQFSDGLEDRGLLESSTRLKPHEAQNYRKKALWVSWFSIIVTLALAVAAFTVSVMRYSASAFGFAFDAILDVLSSVIVLWRYSNAAAVHSAHREYIACVILGVIFLLSSICIVVKAIHDLSTRLLPEVDDFLFSVSILSGILCSILAVLKFMLGKVLTSRALITDGFNSLVGGVMGFSILLSAEVFKHDSAVWYLDGSIGVLIGLTIFAYGVKLLIDMVPRVRQTRHYEMFE
uniref:Transmembrane protein 163 n=3 Tax=Macaca TaxID=9539 RepID=A0A2K5WDE7_MACFA